MTNYYLITSDDIGRNGITKRDVGKCEQEAKQLTDYLNKG